MVKYLLLFIQSILSTAQVASNSAPSLGASTRVTRIFQDVLNATKAHRASLVIQDRLQTEDAVLNEISRTISSALPTTSVRFDDSPPRNLPPAFIATSSTLILYIYTSNTPPDSLEMRTITDTMRLLVYNDHRQKILLTFILASENNDFRKFFEHAWTLYFLDLTILELSIPDSSRSIVHIYNPFARIYTRETYSPGIQWFPYKLKNLHGYPIRIDVLSRPAHSSLMRNSQGYPMKYRGPDARALGIFSRRMNFTVLHYPRTEEYVDLTVVNGTLAGHMGHLQSGHIQILATTVPYVKFPGHEYIARARSVCFERWCPVVPVVYVQHGIDTGQVFAMVLFTVAIVIVFWVSSLLVKSQGPLRQPMTIFSSLISVSVPRQPSGSAERILFLAVLLVSSIYSSRLHENLIKSNFRSLVQVKYRTVEDLLQAGLTAVLHDVLFNVTFDHSRGAFLKFKDTAIRVQNIGGCVDYLLAHRNVTCFMEQSMATAAIYERTFEGKANVELTDLCYWIPPVGYIFHKYSPYIEPISDLMVRTTESGIRDRWYIDYMDELVTMDAGEKSVEKETESLKVLLINIAWCGYPLAFIVFLGEVAWGIGK